MTTLLLAFAIVLLVAIAISGISHRTVMSTAVLFLVAGFILGEGVTGVLSLQPDDEIVTTVAELALFTVLFTDGQQIGVRELRRAWRLPGRALLLGMPLTFAITSVLGVLLLGLSWPEALLVAAVLAPTDPVFAAAIIGRREIPGRLRHLLSVESGVNDGLALPVVLVLIAAIGGPVVDFAELGLELGLGVAVGVAVPLIVSAVLRIRIFTSTPMYAALSPVAVGLIVLGISYATHANLYLAAFAAGITIASVAPEMRDAFHEFGELVTELLKLLAILIFGALVTPAVLADVPLLGYVFAVLALVFARPAAVEIALLRSQLDWRERLTAAWFGPRGFASVLYGLLVLNSGAEHAEKLFHLIVVAIVLSIVAHSSSDVPIANYFARLEGRTTTTAAEPDSAPDEKPLPVP